MRNNGKRKPALKKEKTHAVFGFFGAVRLPFIFMTGLILIGTAAAVNSPLTSSPTSSSPNNATTPQNGDLQPTLSPNVHASLQLFTFNPLVSPPPNPNSPQNNKPTTGGANSGTGNTNEIITVTTTISGLGFNIILTLHYPKNGGQLTGSATGDCTGPISGTYQGLPSGSISGTATATCSVLGFISTNASMTFTGNINATNTQATLNYNAKIFGTNMTGTEVLPLAQQ